MKRNRSDLYRQFLFGFSMAILSFLQIVAVFPILYSPREREAKYVEYESLVEKNALKRKMVVQKKWTMVQQYESIGIWWQDKLIKLQKY